MIGDIAKFIILEKTDKQILNKVPYYFFIALVFHFLCPNTDVSMHITALLIVFFLFSTAYFNHLVNKKFDDIFSTFDIRSFRKMMCEVYSKRRSILDDIDISSDLSLILAGVVAGIIQAITFILSFYIAIQLIYPENQFLVLIVPFFLLIFYTIC